MQGVDTQFAREGAVALVTQTRLYVRSSTRLVYLRDIERVISNKKRGGVDIRGCSADTQLNGLEIAHFRCLIARAARLHKLDCRFEHGACVPHETAADSVASDR